MVNRRNMIKNLNYFLLHSLKELRPDRSIQLLLEIKLDKHSESTDLLRGAHILWLAPKRPCGRWCKGEYFVPAPSLPLTEVVELGNNFWSQSHITDTTGGEQPSLLDTSASVTSLHGVMSARRDIMNASQSALLPRWCRQWIPDQAQAFPSVTESFTALSSPRPEGCPPWSACRMAFYSGG